MMKHIRVAVFYLRVCYGNDNVWVDLKTDYQLPLGLELQHSYQSLLKKGHIL